MVLIHTVKVGDLHMKKSLLVLFSMLFLSLSASAVTTYTKYSPTGKPISIRQGWGPEIPYATYKNNLRNNTTYIKPPMETYRYPRRYYNRHYRTYNYPVYNTPVYTQPVYTQPVYTQPVVITNTETSKPLSRLDRNYVIPRKETYVRDGITYYN